MVRKFFYLLALVLFVVSCGSTARVDSDETVDLRVAIARSAADIIRKVPPNTTIAFFNISAGDYSVVAEFVIEEISAVLVDRAKLIVVDRHNMDVIDAEHEFQMSGRVSDDAIISIAKKYGAATVVSCSVSGQFDLRRMRVRALDVETGRVLSLTSHSVKNLSDYAVPQPVTQRENNVQTARAQYPQTISSQSSNRVYVAGYYFRGGSTLDKMHGYWVNGARTDLTAGVEGSVDAIAVSGGRVYAAGSHNYTACYWVDGIRTELPVPTSRGKPNLSKASAIAVSGGKIYVAGYVGIFHDYETNCYWVDGVRTDLPIPSGTNVLNSRAKAIAVSGGTVYVAGYYGGSPLDYTACYWVDGVRTNLPVPRNTKSSIASAIMVSGGKVYVAGYYESPDYTACYWVDGVRTDLPVPAGTRAFTTAIAVSGGKVYVAGAVHYGAVSTACYWADGVRTDLSGTSGDGIAVSGGTVYVAGYYSYSSGLLDTTACYWADGVRTDLPVPAGTGAFTTAIAVEG